MKSVLWIGVLGAAALGRAQTCNDTFALQAAVQIMRSGPTSNLTSTVKNLKTDLSNLDTLNYASYMAYKYPVAFKPNCTDTTTPAKITYWENDTLTHAFATVTENYPRIQLFDSSTPLQNHPEYWEWFGFYPDNAATLNFYLGRIKTSNDFENWYGNAYLDDSVKSPTTGLWSDSIGYLGETVGPLDSAKLDTLMFIANGWLSKPVDANHRPYLYIQTVKLSFGIEGGAAVSPAARASGDGFAAWQQDGVVWIRTGSDLANRGEPLDLFDMFGRKTAVLYPSGYLYSWNGKSRTGGAAPSGVYFVRSSDHILGKFVYTR